MLVNTSEKVKCFQRTSHWCPKMRKREGEVDQPLSRSFCVHCYARNIFSDLILRKICKAGTITSISLQRRACFRITSQSPTITMSDLGFKLRSGSRATVTLVLGDLLTEWILGAALDSPEGRHQCPQRQPSAPGRPGASSGQEWFIPLLHQKTKTFN